MAVSKKEGWCPVLGLRPGRLLPRPLQGAALEGVGHSSENVSEWYKGGAQRAGGKMAVAGVGPGKSRGASGHRCLACLWWRGARLRKHQVAWFS